MNGYKVPTDKAKLQAYIGDALRDALIKDAESNDRSISAEVTSILERYKDPNHFLIRLPEKVRELIEDYSERESRTVENLIEWIVIQYINNEERT
jgi:hypothetical protein